MGRKRRGRDVHGVIVLDKPAGISSGEAVQQVKRLFAASKVGHTGSLDPLATGVLPLCFGEATKFSQYLLDSDKRYLAKLRLGVATDSGDADGKVIAERPVPALTPTALDAALDSFRGEFEQVPSMFSAVKHQGKPLYKLARQGIEVERQARPVTVYANDVVALEGAEVTLNIHCSKGTYVRNIAHDLGEALGCGAHVCELRRTQAGPYAEADLVTMEELEARRAEGRSLDDLLRPVATAVGQWPPVELADAPAFYLKQGQPVFVPHAPTRGWVRLYERGGARQPAMPRLPAERVAEDNADGVFLGVGEILEDGRVAPRRLVVHK